MPSPDKHFWSTGASQSARYARLYRRGRSATAVHAARSTDFLLISDHHFRLQRQIAGGAPHQNQTRPQRLYPLVLRRRPVLQRSQRYMQPDRLRISGREMNAIERGQSMDREARALRSIHGRAKIHLRHLVAGHPAAIFDGKTYS